jgi:two-component system response regulator GlrR
MIGNVPNPDHRQPGFIAISTAMVDVLGQVAGQIGARAPLILVGLPGTGKTALSELIHERSGRRGQLVCYHAGQLQPDHDRGALFEEQGSVTDQVEQDRGLLEEARGGTLVLEDFEKFRASTQRLVLDAVDPSASRRGHTGRRGPVSCRLIIHLRDAPDVLAANGVLTESVRLRLGYGAIRLPTLDERREDIPALASGFLARCGVETEVPGPDRFDPRSMDVLQAALWPGNLWQLRMVIREAYLRANGVPLLRVEQLADLVRLSVRFERRGSSTGNAHAIRLALQLTHGRSREAARLLGMAPSTIYRYQAEGLAEDAALSDSRGAMNQPDKLQARTP